MKKLIICMLAVLGICSCGNKEKFEETVFPHVYLVSQKTDGKLQYGISYMDTTVTENLAQKGYKLQNKTSLEMGTLYTIKERRGISMPNGAFKVIHTRIRRTDFLPIVYDSISLIGMLGHPYLYAWKDGGKKLFTVEGSPLLEGNDPQRIITLGESPYGHCFIHASYPVGLAQTNEGCYLLCGNNQIGPYSMIYPGVSGYFFFENEKVGFCADQYNGNIEGGIYKNKYFCSGKILPPAFDVIIEVYHWGDNKSYLFLGLQDGKWQAYNEHGKPISISAQKLKLYTSLSAQSAPSKYMEAKEKGSICRYGTNRSGVIIIY